MTARSPSAPLAANERRAPRPRAVVGPNAIIQLSAALRAECGTAAWLDVMTAAGLRHAIKQPPTALVPERDAARLFAATRAALPTAEADAVLTTAGVLTADYILAHRIPMIAQVVLRALPPGLGVRVFLAAIRAHAWTFAGSGVVTVAIGRRPSLTIAANPLATPGCPWHVAVLQRLFQRAVTADARVTHRQVGAEDRFELQNHGRVTFARGAQHGV